VRGSHGGDAEASFVDERDVGCFRGEEEEVETIFAKWKAFVVAVASRT